MGAATFAAFAYTTHHQTSEGHHRMRATTVVKATALYPMQYPVADNIVYNLPIIHSMAELIAKHFNSKINFINLVCRGCSGAMIASVIASLVPQVRKIYYLRKDHECTHDHGNGTSFPPDPSEVNIFVDDLIETGSTLVNASKLFPFKIHGVVVSGGIGLQANEATHFIKVDKVLCSSFYKSD